MTNLRGGDCTFFDNADILNSKGTSYTELHPRGEVYDENYWEQLSIVPLETAIEEQVNEKLRVRRDPTGY